MIGTLANEMSSSRFNDSTHRAESSRQSNDLQSTICPTTTTARSRITCTDERSALRTTVDLRRKKSAADCAPTANAKVAVVIHQLNGQPRSGPRHQQRHRTAAKNSRRPERRYELVRRKRSAPLWLGIPVGVAMLIAGLIWSHHVAGRCSGLNLAVQLAGSDTRLRWMLHGCFAPEPRQVATLQLFVADLFVIVGYLLAGTLILAAGWWRYEATALRRATWVLWLPAMLAAADFVEGLPYPWPDLQRTRPPLCAVRWTGRIHSPVAAGIGGLV